MLKRVDAVRTEMREIVAGFDAACTDAHDAKTLVEWFAEIERFAVAGKTFAAGRVAETPVWAKHGDRSPEHWLARVSGTGLGEATSTLETAARLEELPATEERPRGRLGVARSLPDLWMGTGGTGDSSSGKAAASAHRGAPPGTSAVH